MRAFTCIGCKMFGDTQLALLKFQSTLFCVNLAGEDWLSIIYDIISEENCSISFACSCGMWHLRCQSKTNESQDKNVSCHHRYDKQHPKFCIEHRHYHGQGTAYLFR